MLIFEYAWLPNFLCLFYILASGLRILNLYATIVKT